MAGIRTLAMVALMASTAAAASRPMTVDDLLAVKSVSDPQVSPDSRRVVYVVSEVDRAANKSNTSLWGVPLAGGTPRRLTAAPGVNNHPRWSPDGKNIAFVSNRGGTSQVWVLPADGGEAHQLTKVPVDVAGPVWSPDGKSIAFAAEVYPGKSPEETAARDKDRDGSKTKVRVYDKLMIRHWNAWDEGKRSHLFVCDSRTGVAKDLTQGLDVNTPPAPFGGSDDYAWAPDGKTLVFTAEPARDTAWSTNTDVWQVPLNGGTARNLTESNPGADAKPTFSRVGNLLAYLSQARAGFEADLWILNVRDMTSGKTTRFPKLIDRPIQSIAWEYEEPDNLDRHFTIDAVVDSEGAEPVLAIKFREGDLGRFVADGPPIPRVKGGATSAVVPVATEGKPLVYVRSLANRPAELYKVNTTDPASKEDTTLRPTAPPVALTHHNDALAAALDLSPAESFTYKGADGDDVSGWLVKPPGFDAGKKYPVVFLIHGGPQGAWHDEWHARWNYAMFASPGYAVVAINPRGSTGYGQQFTDQISQDWTGKVYDDLMKGLDHALKTYPFLDRDRVAAAGGSYGGFMVNWIAGHSDRFKTLVSHAGVFDLTSKYGTTEELWFPEWEFGGTPWDKPDVYRSQSPSGFVKNFKTPTLVVHGALDFRVPDAQGLGMFTALQRQGVKSRLVFFPDEGHWILKPANRAEWWDEVLGWLAKSLKS